MRRALRRRRLAHEGDQAPGAFTEILADLVDRVPGARAAALVDFDGECVDYASQGDPFEVKVAAAHLRIVLNEAQAAIADSTFFSVSGSTRSYVVRSLPQGYALVMVMACGATDATSGRAIPLCVQRLAAEAGWKAPPAPAWHPLEVRTDPRGRPLGIAHAEGTEELEILGTVARGLARYERGWRVRFSGGEATLVREPTGYWYVDERLNARASSPPT